MHQQDGNNPGLSRTDLLKRGDAASQQYEEARDLCTKILIELEGSISDAMKSTYGENMSTWPEVYRDFVACAWFETMYVSEGLRGAIGSHAGDTLPFLADAYRRFSCVNQASAVDMIHELFPDLDTAEERFDWLSDSDPETAVWYHKVDAAFKHDGYDFSSFNRLRYALSNPSLFFETE